MYNYRGQGTAAKEGAAATPEPGPASRQQYACTSFGTFFKLRFALPLATGGEVLCKDFCLFLNNGAHVLLASHTPLADMAHQRTGIPGHPFMQQPRQSVAASTTLHVVSGQPLILTLNVVVACGKRPTAIFTVSEVTEGLSDRSS